MAEISDDKFVLVIDEMPLKRTLITQFLTQWGENLGCTVKSSGFDNFTTSESSRNCKLVILSIGDLSPSEPRVLNAYRVLVAMNQNRPVVVIGDRPNVENVEQALKAGMAGYIPTSLAADVVVAALDFVLAGGSYVPPEVLLCDDDQKRTPPLKPRALPSVQSAEATLSGQPEPTENTGGNRTEHAPRCMPECEDIGDKATAGNLTRRQIQVLACLKRACSNKEIARELDMSEATVKVHVQQVMRKLGATNRTHAAVIGVAPSRPMPLSTVRLASVPGSSIQFHKRSVLSRSPARAGCLDEAT